jgi:hypothetical protein
MSQAVLNSRNNFRRILGLNLEERNSGSSQEESEYDDDDDEDDYDDEEDGYVESPTFNRINNYLEIDIGRNCNSNQTNETGQYIDGITYDTLRENNSIKASDGQCYDVDTLINIYNNARNTPGKNLELPFNRSPFTDDDIRKVRTAIADRSSRGVKKRKTYKRKSYKRKSYKRKSYKRKSYKRKSYKRLK